MAKKFLNVLDDAPAASHFTSTSRLELDSVGCCPKCQNAMTVAQVTKDKNALWCNTCRVTFPLAEVGS